MRGYLLASLIGVIALGGCGSATTTSTPTGPGTTFIGESEATHRAERRAERAQDAELEAEREETKSEPPPSRHTLGYELAVIDGHYPDASETEAYDQAIRRVERVCPRSSSQEIADMATRAKELIEKAGQEFTTRQALAGVAGSIPRDAVGVIKCLDVFAAFVTLTKQEG